MSLLEWNRFLSLSRFFIKTLHEPSRYTRLFFIFLMSMKFCVTQQSFFWQSNALSFNKISYCFSRSKLLFYSLKYFAEILVNSCWETLRFPYLIRDLSILFLHCILIVRLYAKDKCLRYNGLKVTIVSSSPFSSPR